MLNKELNSLHEFFISKLVTVLQSGMIILIKRVLTKRKKVVKVLRGATIKIFSTSNSEMAMAMAISSEKIVK
jgi:hypothetical protein